MPADKCINCGGHAAQLCDFTLGGVHGGYGEYKGKPYRVHDINKPHYTCDVPICRACATHAGNLFISGKNPGIETIDYCPLHSHGENHDIKPLTEDEVRAMRREIEAHYRRKHFFDVKKEGSAA